MVYYAMPLIMKTENGAPTQLCVNPNQVTASENNYNGQLPAPQQAQLINLSNSDMSGSSPSSQNNYTYQLLTSNDHLHQQQQQQPNQSHNGQMVQQQHTNQRAPKQVKSFKCDQCNMTFTTKSAHTSHIKSHAKQQQVSATAINASNSNINANQQMQSSDPYQCDVCKKTFAVPARLVSFCCCCCCCRETKYLNEFCKKKIKNVMFLVVN